MNHLMLTDKEVCAFLRISPRTLRAILRDGPSDSRTADLRKCAPIRLSGGGLHGQRRWDVRKLAEVIGMDYKDIWAALA